MKAECSCCGRVLRSSLFFKGVKSCPNCSADAGKHIFYLAEGPNDDFKTRYGGTTYEPWCLGCSFGRGKKLGSAWSRATSAPIEINCALTVPSKSRKVMLPTIENEKWNSVLSSFPIDNRNIVEHNAAYYSNASDDIGNLVMHHTLGAGKVVSIFHRDNRKMLKIVFNPLIMGMLT